MRSLEGNEQTSVRERMDGEHLTATNTMLKSLYHLSCRLAHNSTISNVSISSCRRAVVGVVVVVVRVKLGV